MTLVTIRFPTAGAFQVRANIWLFCNTHHVQWFSFLFLAEATVSVLHHNAIRHISSLYMHSEHFTYV